MIKDFEMKEVIEPSIAASIKNNEEIREEVE